ncbi:MAG: hypothetical protein VB835_03940 [Pirellulales bacterium]
MSLKLSTAAYLTLAAVALTVGSGCVTSQGPYLGAVGIPIPVSPFFQDRLEDESWEQERYNRMPILGPLTEDSPDIGMDEPSDDQIFRKFLKIKSIEGGIPLLWEPQINDVRIVKEKISDYVDPPRVYPLIGPARLHHVHWKCIVYYSEKVRIGWPIPYTTRNDDGQEVIYIDRNHFHMVGDVDTGPGANF